MLLKNSSIESDNREDFDDIIDFNVIFAQNICFFNVANKINEIKINKINSIKINKINFVEVNKIMKNVENEVNDEIENFCENMTNNASSLNINKTSFSSFF